MHLVEHEALMPGTPHAYEITWETCACGRPQDHRAPSVESETAAEMEEFLMPEDLLAVAA